MRTLIAAIAAAAATGVCGQAAAQVGPPLQRVESEVYQVDGDVGALTRKAQTCMAQVLKPGVINAPTILSADVVGGVVVANNAFEYSNAISTTPARSVVTFQAKPGRFRLVNTSIEHFLLRSWSPVYTHRFGGSEAVSAQLQWIMSRVAGCIKAAPLADDF